MSEWEAFYFHKFFTNEYLVCISKMVRILAFCWITYSASFYPTACWGIVFTHGVRMGGPAGRRPVGQAAGKRLSGLYLSNRRV